MRTIAVKYNISYNTYVYLYTECQFEYSINMQLLHFSHNKLVMRSAYLKFELGRHPDNA